MNTTSRLIGYLTAKGIKRAVVLTSKPNRHTIKDEQTGVTLTITDKRIIWVNS